MNRLERRVARDLRQIAELASPSPDAWDSILTRLPIQGLDDVPDEGQWSRVHLDRLDDMPVQLTEEEAPMIELDTPNTTDEPRKGPKRALLAGLLVAAAVVAIAFVAIRKDDPASPADQPSPAVTVPATVPPRALFGTPNEQFVPGTYFIDEVDGYPTPRIFLTIGEGWDNRSDKWGIRSGGGGFMSFSRPDRVFVDACYASEGFHPGPLTTLDGLVAALREQGGWTNVTEPSSITVNGYTGKTFQRTAPSDFTNCETTGPAKFRGWEYDDANGLTWSYYDPGEVETLRVVDADGTIIIINSRMKPDDQVASAAELAAALESIRIEQR